MTESTFTHPTQPWQVTVYKSGNSKVITIPATSRVKVGDVFTMSESDKLITLKPKSSRSSRHQADLTKLHRLTGNLPGLTEGLDDIDELESFIEGIYE